MRVFVFEFSEGEKMIPAYYSSRHQVLLCHLTTNPLSNFFFDHVIIVEVNM